MFECSNTSRPPFGECQTLKWLQKEPPSFAPTKNRMWWLTCFPRSPLIFNLFLDTFWVISRAPPPRLPSLYTHMAIKKWALHRNTHLSNTQTLSAHLVQALWIKVLLSMRHFSCSSQVCTSWVGIGHAGVDNQGCYMRSLINMVLFAVNVDSHWEQE